MEPAQQQGLQKRVDAVRRIDRSRYRSFLVDGVSVGHVRHDFAEHLRSFPEVFRVSEASVRFVRELDDVSGRSEAMARVAGTLARQGLLSPWRDETYDVGAQHDSCCLFRLERAAVRFFGFLARAVHVNGLVNVSGEPYMWIARRSANKAIDPGMLDNLVGGGLASGLTIAQTVVKESWEEAGIPAALAGTARAQGQVRVLREVPEGLHTEVIYLHDLWLPADFIPKNQDGEVAELRLTAMRDVLAELAADGRYTADAALVALDCLARCGVADKRWVTIIRAV